MYVLGVDGGNTKTIAVVCQMDGKIVGYGRSGCGDIYAFPEPEMAIKHLNEAVQQALKMTDISPQSLQIGVFSLAGADYQEDYNLLESAMRERQYGNKIIVYNDAIGALRAGSPDGTGVAVVCGTGTAIGSRTSNGRFWHSSFWHDVGGARHLGAKVMTAIARAELGITSSTSLKERALTCFGEQKFETILYRYTRRDKRQIPEINLLAPIVLEEAERGDPIAVQIVYEHGKRLGEYAVAAARQVELQDFYLVLAGSVFKTPSKIFPDAIIEEVHRAVPTVTPVYSRYEPVIGTLMLALEANDTVVTDSILSAIEQTIPPERLFVT